MVFWKLKFFQNLLSNSQLETLHDMVMVWLVVIMFIVVVVVMNDLSNSNITMMGMNSTHLEVIWTLIPIIILVSIAVPSIYVLIMQEYKYLIPFYSLKIASSQWNWYSEQAEVKSYQIIDDSGKVDHISNFIEPISLSSDNTMRIVLSSTDVLHSLGIPSLGVKLDSNPGRLNCVMIEPNGVVTYMTGSCYELCGNGHSAMPYYINMN